jgi:hypothetical protein
MADDIQEMLARIRDLLPKNLTIKIFQHYSVICSFVRRVKLGPRPDEGTQTVKEINDEPHNLSTYQLWLCSPLLHLSRLFSFLIILQSTALVGRGISPSQGLYLSTEHTHRDIHALSGIRTHDPNVRAGGDGSYLRPRGHYDRPHKFYWLEQIEDEMHGMQ